MADSSRQKENAKIKQSSNHLRKFPYNQHEGYQARHNRSPGGAEFFAPAVLTKPQKEEGDSAILSSQRQAVMDRGHSPNSEEVVMDTRQVVVGTRQRGGEAVGCQPIRPCEEEEKEG